MAGIQYKGRNPDTDYSVIHKKYADSRYSTLKVDLDYVNQATAAEAAARTLVTPDYVDAQDDLRAQKSEVDAADAGFLPITQYAVANGVAPIGADGMINPAYLPPLTTERKPFIVPVTTMHMTLSRECTQVLAKEYKAATLVIPDPGFAYIPMLFATIQGGAVNATVPNRLVGGSSFGQVTILRAADDVKYGWVVTSGMKTLDFYDVFPFGDGNTTPTTYPPLTGTHTFEMWLGLWGGTTYTFMPNPSFYAICYPGF